jgi:hypothetical protein
VPLGGAVAQLTTWRWYVYFTENYLRLPYSERIFVIMSNLVDDLGFSESTFPSALFQ